MPGFWQRLLLKLLPKGWSDMDIWIGRGYPPFLLTTKNPLKIGLFFSAKNRFRSIKGGGGFLLSSFPLTFWENLIRGIPHICHLDHLYIGGEKIGHVEKFQISIHDRCGEIWNFSTCRGISDFSHNRCGEIRNFAKFGGISKFYTWQMWRNLKFTLFLVVKSVLWQFTLFFA